MFSTVSSLDSGEAFSFGSWPCGPESKYMCTGSLQEGTTELNLSFLLQIPLCKVIRFNIDYTIHFIEEMMPEVREKIT